MPACVVRPQQTEGPFFIDDKLNRSDIRSNPGRSDARPGAILELAFAVSRLNGGACAPLAGAQVDVWHCDALGAYSDGAQKFLRGYQVTDDTGAARFVTIYPGAYGGRAVHIHFKIRTAQRQEFTSQIYFDEAVTDRVYAVEPYAAERPASAAQRRRRAVPLRRSPAAGHARAERRGLRHDVRARAHYLDGQQLGSALPRHDVGRVARRGDRRRRRRLSAAAAALRGRHPARPRSARARARARSSPSARSRTPSRSSPASSRGVTLGTPDRLLDPQRGHALRATTARCRRSTGRATPTTPTTRSTASATGAAAVARARARPPAASPPARSRASCWRRVRRRDRRLGLEGRRASRVECDVERVTRDEVDATPDPLPRPGDGRADDRGRRGGAQGRQLARRRRHLRGARLPAGLGRAGLRSPRGRPGQGDDEPARQQGLRDRLRLRRHRPDRPRAQRRVLHGRATACARAPTAAAACRAASPTARRSTSASRSSRPRRSCASRTPSTSRHEDTTITGRGRHDPCVLPRAVPIVEAMAALVLADHALRHQAVVPPPK